MPYVDAEIRAQWHLALEHVEDTMVSRMTPGALNYIITTLCDLYVARKGLGYTALNDVMGVLAGVDREFYRRVVVPYEDAKCAENGDVYSSAPYLPTTIPTRKPWPVTDLPLDQWGQWVREGTRHA